MYLITVWNECQQTHANAVKVKYLRPNYTTFGDFTDETNTFQHTCNVVDSSPLFDSQDFDSLNDQKVNLVPRNRHNDIV